MYNFESPTLSVSTVTHHGPEHGFSFIEHVREQQSSEFMYLEKALLERDLIPQPERAHLFTLYSPDSHQALAVAIMPFSSKDFSIEAGLSTAGGHSQAVIVHIQDRVEITGFETLAVVDGEVVTKEFDIAELKRMGSRRLAKEAGKVKAAQPLIEVTPYQAQAMATQAYHSLLNDNISRSVHPPEEIRALGANTGIVAEIAALVLFRTSGSACCSCSCSCWGSSSCSSSYFSN